MFHLNLHCEKSYCILLPIDLAGLYKFGHNLLSFGNAAKVFGTTALRFGSVVPAFVEWSDYRLQC